MRLCEWIHYLELGNSGGIPCFRRPPLLETHRYRFLLVDFKSTLPSPLNLKRDPLALGGFPCWWVGWFLQRQPAAFGHPLLPSSAPAEARQGSRHHTLRAQRLELELHAEQRSLNLQELEGAPRRDVARSWPNLRLRMKMLLSRSQFFVLIRLQHLSWSAILACQAMLVACRSLWWRHGGS